MANQLPFFQIELKVLKNAVQLKAAYQCNQLMLLRTAYEKVANYFSCTPLGLYYISIHLLQWVKTLLFQGVETLLFNGLKPYFSMG
ncbi:MAG: hypothetical protein ACI9P5_004279 [Saprospiraceae bacterium]|jgi:hypothetical protein